MFAGRALAALGRRWVAPWAAASLVVGAAPVVAVGLTPTAALAAPVAAPAAPAEAGLAAATPTPPALVTSDALPTWQINGVVWSQAIVGSTVYVTGSFTKARPPGVAAGGAGEVDAANIFAYDLATGARVTGFAHSLNAQGRTIRVSPDGTRLYVGGDFTTVDGQARGHLAAFALPGGALTAWAPSTSGNVRGIAVTDSTVYAGGSFGSAGGQSRASIAAFSAATGAVLPWNPGIGGGEIWTMTMSPDRAKVIPGGSFTTLGGAAAYGMGAVDAATGAALPWAAQEKIRAGGPKGAITSLKSDGSQVYGTAYSFGAGATWEGPFALNPADGSINWANDCLGDTYDIAPAGPVTYNVSHMHDCTAIDSFPDTNPRSRWQKAGANWSTATNVTTRNDVYGWNFIGVPYAANLHWWPDFGFGTYTSAGQAGWAIDASSDGQWVVVGGEFPRVNGVAQQGMVRFRQRPAAPRKVGPSYTTQPSTPTPATTAVSLEAGSIRVTWGSAWDKDDPTLKYEVLRDNKDWVATLTGDSNFWQLPRMGFVDRGLAPGSSHSYQIRVTDPDGNTLWSPKSATVTVGTDAASAYAGVVRGDGAEHLWRLGEPSGATALDHIGFDDLALTGGYTRGAAGSLAETDQATTFDGVNGLGVTPTRVQGPDVFSVEAWFRTTSTTGGKIVGFGDTNTGLSSNYDRHIYLNPDGRATFGIYDNGSYVLTSASALNDGQWHHVVGTLGADGMSFVVDGRRVGTLPSVTKAQPYQGFWRVGGDRSWNGADYFAGDIDEVALYPTALALTDIQDHYRASGRILDIPTRPSDSYGQAVWDDGADLFWRFDETSGTTAKDSSPSENNGILNGGGTLGVPGAIGSGTALALDGGDDHHVYASQQLGKPQVFSQEMWFSTTTTNGGRLMGFGCNQTGASNCYDRHVYMQRNGTLVFGTYNGALNTIATPQAYNDGAWHHMVTTMGQDGMTFYVDGILIGTHPANNAETGSGYWRVGGDNHWGDGQRWIAATVDEYAVYPTVLSQSQVRAHFFAGGGQLPNIAPTASFTATTDGLTLNVDAAASSDSDGTLTSYAWDFGDGATASGVTATHTYGSAGPRQVTLTVTDNRGGTGSTSRTVRISTFPTPVRPADAYGRAVWDDGATLFYRLDETGGSTVQDSSPAQNDGTSVGGVTLQQPGVAGTAAALGGGWDNLIVSQQVPGPQTFSLEAWFQTTTTQGGKIIGFGNQPAGQSNNYDRHIWMKDDGTLTFGVWNGRTDVISTTAAYNDGAWHHVLGTLGSAGLTLSVDGQLIGTLPGVTTAQPYDGYWRIGGDTGWGGNSSLWFAGTVDEVAVYPTQLSPAQAAAHFTAGGGLPPNQAPTAAFTATADLLHVAVDGSGSADADGSIASWAWNFGDGSTGTGVTASHTYAAGGTYTVTLTVTDNRGGTATVTHDVTVAPNQAPTASFTHTENVLAVSVDASASSDADGSIASYGWDFGDGSTGTGVSGTHTYAAPGTYTVTLTVTDDRGATGTSTQSVTVALPANQLPTAAFTTAASYLQVAVDGSGSSDADGSIASWAWDFGDGSTGTGVTASHTYAAGGTYTVTLTVTDNRGGTATVTHDVTVAPNQAPTASFTHTENNLSVSVDAAGSTDADGSIAGYAWSWGDGSADGSGATASHGYAAAGSYTITLTVTDDQGLTATHQATVTVAGPPNQLPTAAFTATADLLHVAVDGSGSADADGSIAAWAWDFGDGSTGTGVTAAHDYAAGGSYTVTLTVTDDRGGSATTTRQVTVAANQAPTAAFTSTVNNLTVMVDASGSADADGTIASYAWDFGDGTTGTGATGTHTYAAAGTYTVTLTVTDNRGATGTSTASVTVALPPNQLPTAAFTATADLLHVAVDGSGSADADGSIAAWAWDFGDGSTGTGATASHTYATAGTYTVTLTVTDNRGGTASVTHPVTVAPNQAPTASFTHSESNLAVSVNGSGSSDPDGSIASYAWTFGDGSTGTGVTASHTYAAAGTYTVTLTVTDNRGATGTSTASVTVALPPNQLPTAAFTATVNNLAVSVNGSGSSDPDGSIASYAWTFGDGGTATGATASRTYAAAGTYTVTLTVTDDRGGQNSTTRQVTVTGPTALAQDGFGRTLASGWGSAEVGGAWTLGGSSSLWSVSGGQGRLSLAKGSGYSAYLPGVSTTSVELAASVGTDPRATGGGTYVSYLVRRVSATVDYRSKVFISATGAVTAGLSRMQSGTETSLGSATVTGVTYAAGDRLNVRVQAVGTSPTTLKVKVWKAGTTEPTAWLLTRTDSTAAFQAAGSVGFYAYVSSSSTVTPVLVTFDDVWAGAPRP